MRWFGARRGTPRRYKDRGVFHRRDLRVWWWVTVGGGIFALRRPRPYSRLCGEIVGGITASTTIYAHAGIYGNGVEADNDAARCVATSFEERGNRF